MTENITAFLKGRVYWFKALGDPRLNEFEDERQWSFDLEVTPETKEWLKENGLLDKIKKTKEGVVKKTPDGKEYISFRKSEYNREGEKSKSWRVVDKDGAPWDNGTLVGNGSMARVKVSAKSYTMKGRTVNGLYAMAIQIGDLVEFKSNEFGNWEDEAPKTKPASKKAPAKADALDDSPWDE